MFCARGAQALQTEEGIYLSPAGRGEATMDRVLLHGLPAPPQNALPGAQAPVISLHEKDK